MKSKQSQQIDQLLALLLDDLKKDDDEAWQRVEQRLFYDLLLLADSLLQNWCHGDDRFALEAVITTLRRLRKHVVQGRRCGRPPKVVRVPFTQLKWAYIKRRLRLVILEIYWHKVRPEQERTVSADTMTIVEDDGFHLAELLVDETGAGRTADVLTVEKEHHRMMMEQFAQHLSRLSEQEQKVIRCLFYRNPTPALKEIAEELNCSVDVVKYTKRLALAKLKECEALDRLKDRGEIPPEESLVFERKRIGGQNLKEIAHDLDLADSKVSVLYRNAEQKVAAECLRMAEENDDDFFE